MVSASSGFLVVDKPMGVTSFSMVALLRRLTGVKRVGHAGTLDPLATGVLPVAIGQATRLIEYMDDAPKAYVARVRFGDATDTYDAEGVVTFTGDASTLTAEAIEAELAGFIGDIEQTPPLYSAIKLAGKPLYRYAREGAAVEASARTVRVESIEMRSFEATTDGGVEAQIEVQCGKGTYIRSLAHDLGQRLACGAHLVALRRMSSGGFSIDEAHTHEEITAAAGAGEFAELILAPDRAVERRPAMIFGEQHAKDVRAGRDVVAKTAVGIPACRAYDITGEFLGVLREAGRDRWHPEKVLSSGRSSRDRGFFGESP